MDTVLPGVRRPAGDTADQMIGRTWPSTIVPAAKHPASNGIARDVTSMGEI